MVGHEGDAVDLQAVSVGCRSKKSKESVAVVVVSDDVSAVNAAGGDVVPGTGIVESWS
jgi:hypothetical protein